MRLSHTRTILEIGARGNPVSLGTVGLLQSKAVFAAIEKFLPKADDMYILADVNVNGITEARDALEETEQPPEVRGQLIVSDAQQLPLADASVDVAILANVLNDQHPYTTLQIAKRAALALMMGPELPPYPTAHVLCVKRRVVNDVKRVLKQNGRLILVHDASAVHVVAFLALQKEWRQDPALQQETLEHHVEILRKK